MAMGGRRLAVSLAVLALCADAKVTSGRTRLSSEESERFIDKFSFSRRELGKISGKFTAVGGERYSDGHRHQLQLALFSDLDWAKYQASLRGGSLCSERVKLATILKPLELVTDGARAKASGDFAFDEIVAGTERSHYWYALVADCALEFYPARTPALDFRVHFLNGNSELPADEAGMPTLHLLATLALGGACAAVAARLRAQLASRGQVHLAATASAGALALQTVACASELVHLWVYAADGKGLRWRHGRPPVDFYADTCQNLSELVVVVVVVSVACGWTLVDGAGGAANVKKMGALALGVGALQLVLELVGRRYEADFSSFHDHDHWPGAVLMLLRAAVCAVVWRGALRAGGFGAGGGVDGDGGHKPAAKFLRYFALVGSAWLLAFPWTCLVIAPRFPEARRHFVVTASALLLQSLALCALLMCFLGVGDAGRAFLKISTVGATGSLDVGLSGGLGGGGLGGGGGGGGGSAASVAATIRRKVAVD